MKNISNKSNQTLKSGVQQCQKCYNYGHWTYECKNSSAYLYRPSRTTLFKYINFNKEILL